VTLPADFPFDRHHWIFDLDGTLTVAMHDFDAIRATLGLPVGRPILEEIASRPAEEAAALQQHLDLIEADLISAATAAAGARDLLDRLRGSGYRVGILTRNNVANALGTLDAAGLGGIFGPDDVVGRDDATPKPAPDGILTLLNRWDADPQDSVIVGDYLFDLQAGRAAAVGTVYVDVAGEFPWADQADLVVVSLCDLLDL